MKRKKCRVCKKLRLIKCFSRRYTGSEIRLTICQYCNYEIYGKRWIQKNITPQIRREKKLQQLYGITSKEHEQILAFQEGKCAICSTEKDLMIDHDHNSKIVRGLLCRQCNTGLGMFKDSLVLLESAMDYLFIAPIFDIRKFEN